MKDSAKEWLWSEKEFDGGRVFDIHFIFNHFLGKVEYQITVRPESGEWFPVGKKE